VVREAARVGLGGTREFVALYGGPLGVMQGLDTLLDAAALLKQRAPLVRIALIGGGVEAPRLAARAHAERLTNVRFHDRVAPNEVGRYLVAADALVVHLKRAPLFEVMIPAKTQGSMAADRPLVMAVAGDAADVVARAACGVIAEPSNAESVAAAIERLAGRSRPELDEMGRNARAFYQREMSMEAGVPRFEALFRGVRAAEYASAKP
jgi:glycosyltransferase involved in cell wall biosynthesis